MKTMISFILFAISSIMAQVAGKEFPVNTTTTFSQREPAVASDSKGKFVVVWTSKDSAGETNIVAQIFDKNLKKSGNEIIVNSDSLKSNCKPSIAMNERGYFLISWAAINNRNTGFDIFAKLLDSNGATIVPEFRVNRTAKTSNSNPACALTSRNIIIVAWHAWDNDGSDRGIFSRMFYGDGKPMGKELQLNSWTRYSQCKPSVSLITTDEFVVSWESYGQDMIDKNDYGVYFKICDQEGFPISEELRANTYIKDDQFQSHVSANRKGDFLITWCSWGQDGDKGGIYAQRFLSDGQKFGYELSINKKTKEYQWLPKSVLFDDKSFTVVWSGWLADKNREGIVISTFDKNNKSKGEQIVNTYKTGYQWEPAIAKLNEKEVIVVWSSYGQIKNGDYDIFAKKIKVK